MSLKAKIEAVIYASEEPVTLPQLIGLLGEEAQAELDEIESQQRLLALEAAEPEAGDEDALNAETIWEGEAPADTEAATTEAEPEGAQPATQPAADPASTEPIAGAPDLERAEKSLAEKDLAREATAAAKIRERKLREYFRSLLDHLIADYANENRGLEVREVAGGFRLGTKPEYHDAVRGFVKSLKPPLKLSLQALETLAVVAYKQPVTAPEVSEIRGVDSGGVLGSLMTRKLVTTAGRKQVIGRPILYKTTKEFLVRFGLKDINELPSIEEFEKLAGEFAETDPVQEEIPMEASEASAASEATADHGRGEAAAHSGDSPALNEIDSAPPATNALHESVDDMVNDKSYAPEGGNSEPSRHAAETSAENVEPNANVHAPQADGDDRDLDVADDVIVDGRISGPPPPDASDDNPSAAEAAEREAGNDSGNDAGHGDA